MKTKYWKMLMVVVLVFFMFISSVSLWYCLKALAQLRIILGLGLGLITIALYMTTLYLIIKIDEILSNKGDRNENYHNSDSDLFRK